MRDQYYKSWIILQNLCRVFTMCLPDIAKLLEHRDIDQQSAVLEDAKYE